MIFEQIAKTILRHRLKSILLTLAIIAVLFQSIAKLSFTNDYAAQFGEKNPQYLAYETLLAQYENTDNILIAIRPYDKNVFSQQSLEIITRLTKLAWKTPYSRRVDSISNFVYTYGEEDDVISEPLFEHYQQLTEQQIKARADYATSEPTLKNVLVSEDGKTAAVNITVVLPKANFVDEVYQANEYIISTLKTLQQEQQNFDYYLAGKIVQDRAFFDATGDESATLFPIMFIVILLAIFAILRSLTVTIAILAVVVGSVLATLGTLGWMNLQLTPEALTALIMIAPLAIADCLHIYFIFCKKRREGLCTEQACIFSMQSNIKPIVLTSVTTSIGFLSMLLVEAPPFQHMGLIVAIGVGYALLLSFILFAPLLILIKPWQTQALLIPKVISLSAKIFSHHSNRTIAVLSFLILVSLIGFWQNKIDQNTSEYFSSKMQYRQDVEWINNNLTGINNIQFSIHAKQAHAITDPDYLQHLEAFSNWLRAQNGVVYVSSFADIMKRLNMAMHQNQQQYYNLPTQQELSSQYFTLYEMSLPFGLGLTNRVDFQKSATLVTVNLKMSSNQEIVQLDKRAQQWMQQNMPEYMFAKGTGPDIMYSYQLTENIPSLVKGLAISILLIAAILCYSLGSIKLGLISLIPNFLPILMAFGLWGYVDGEIGLSIAIVMGMTLGIVVDDTVHLISKYRIARQQLNYNQLQASNYAVEMIGPAVLATTFIIAAGFLVLTFSLFTPSVELGLLTALIIVIAVIFDLLILPTIIAKMDNQHA